MRKGIREEGKGVIITFNGIKISEPLSPFPSSLLSTPTRIGLTKTRFAPILSSCRKHNIPQ